MKSKICLIRHGITQGNRENLYYGKTDIPLAEEGREELSRLVEEGIYPRIENADYYTTGLARTEETFNIIYGDREHRTLEDLREIDFGDYEMKSHRELKVSEEYRSWMKCGGLTSPPGGESVPVFCERIKKGFAEFRKLHAMKELSMRHSGKDIASVIVCHGGTISAILDSIYPAEGESIYRWIPDPGHGYILTLEDEIFTGQERF